jgi:hypothetical protein
VAATTMLTMDILKDGGLVTSASQKRGASSP